MPLNTRCAAARQLSRSGRTIRGHGWRLFPSSSLCIDIMHYYVYIDVVSGPEPVGWCDPDGCVPRKKHDTTTGVSIGEKANHRTSQAAAANRQQSWMKLVFLGAPRGHAGIFFFPIARVPASTPAKQQQRCTSIRFQVVDKIAGAWDQLLPRVMAATTACVVARLPLSTNNNNRGESPDAAAAVYFIPTQQ